MPRALLSDIEIEYDIHGTGEPLLLIAGLGGQLIDWEPEFVDLLNHAGFMVIRFDNRDSGLSTRLSHVGVPTRSFLTSVISRRRARVPYRIDDMARDASALLDHLGIGSAHVVGVSMGGMIAQALAIHEPHKVRSLTSLMANTGNRRHGRVSPGLLVRLPFLGRASHADAVRKRVQVLQAISGAGFDARDAERRVAVAVERFFDPSAERRQSLAILASPDRTPLLRKLRMPTLVIHGGRDRLVRPSGGRATASAIGHARLLVFDDMGHDLPRHRWTDIVSAIRHNAGLNVQPALVPA